MGTRLGVSRRERDRAECVDEPENACARSFSARSRSATWVPLALERLIEHRIRPAVWFVWKNASTAACCSGSDPNRAPAVEAFFQTHQIPQAGLMLDQTLERQRIHVALRERADLAQAFSGSS